MNSNQTIISNFEKRKYLLTITILGEGSVSEKIISAGKSTTEYSSGSTTRLTAISSDGSEFSGWNGSIVSSENPLEIQIGESKLI